MTKEYKIFVPKEEPDFTAYGLSELIEIAHEWYELRKKRDVTKDKATQQSDLEEKILDLIDNQDDYTRSDLQGLVTAFVMMHCNLD
jgi:hypothetical protein